MVTRVSAVALESWSLCWAGHTHYSSEALAGVACTYSTLQLEGDSGFKTRFPVITGWNTEGWQGPWIKSTKGSQLRSFDLSHVVIEQWGPQISDHKLYLVTRLHVRFSFCDDISMGIPYEHAEYVCESTTTLGDQFYWPTELLESKKVTLTIEKETTVFVLDRSKYKCIYDSS